MAGFLNGVLDNFDRHMPNRAGIMTNHGIVERHRYRLCRCRLTRGRKQQQSVDTKLCRFLGEAPDRAAAKGDPLRISVVDKIFSHVALPNTINPQFRAVLTGISIWALPLWTSRPFKQILLDN